MCGYVRDACEISQQRWSLPVNISICLRLPVYLCVFVQTLFGLPRNIPLPNRQSSGLFSNLPEKSKMRTTDVISALFVDVEFRNFSSHADVLCLREIFSFDFDDSDLT